MNGLKEQTTPHASERGPERLLESTCRHLDRAGTLGNEKSKEARSPVRGSERVGCSLELTVQVCSDGPDLNSKTAGAGAAGWSDEAQREFLLSKMEAEDLVCPAKRWLYSSLCR